jgi:hypothetical protein
MTTKSTEIRRSQAKRYWDQQYGLELGMTSFEAYLETIPEIPEGLQADDPILPYLALDDPRVPLVTRCANAGVWYELRNGRQKLEYLEGRDVRHFTPKRPYWFRAQNKLLQRIKDKDSRLCPEEYLVKLFAGTIHVGLALLTHHPGLLDRGGMELMGSVVYKQNVFPSLRLGQGQPEIFMERYEARTDPYVDTVVFRWE